MVKLGLVIAEFYEEMAAEMEEQAREYANERGATITETVYINGVYDAPLAADRLARLDNVDGVVALGIVITGDTDHDQVVTHAAAHQLSSVSLERDTPVGFGVIGPDMSEDEANARIEYGADAVNAVVDLVESLPDPS